MATLHNLGLTVEDYIDYIRGKDLPSEKERLIEDHWSDPDFPWKQKSKTRMTFTGIDRKTDINALCAIQQEHPEVEFGVLIAKSRQGWEPRYPYFEHIIKLNGANLNLACHVCGRLARHIIHTGDFTQLENYLNGYINLFSRIQLNVSGMGPEELPESITFKAPSGIREIIIQQHPDKPMLLDRISLSNVPVSVLFDASGGLGIESEFKPVKANYRTGYAGGINPSNVQEKFLQLKNSGIDGDFWIDMESGVRTDDWFDIDKVKQVINIIDKKL